MRSNFLGKNWNWNWKEAIRKFKWGGASDRRKEEALLFL